MREWIVAASRSGVRPDEESFTLLLTNLIVEADDEGIESLRSELEAGAADTGVFNWQSLRDSAKWSAEDLSRMRTSLLVSLMKRDSTESDEALGWAIFERLRKRGEADRFQFNVMLKSAETSIHTRALIDEMIAFNIEPDTVSYNMLLKRLNIEGHEKAALALVETMRRSIGTAPSTKTEEIMKQSSIWTKMHALRVNQLRRLLDANRPAYNLATALQFYELLLSNNLVDTRFLKEIMPHCANSAIMARLVEGAESAGIKMTHMTLKIVMEQLKSEGDEEGATRLKKRIQHMLLTLQLLPDWATRKAQRG
jgi:hypothetical protein